jgi:hypothetical protein
MKTVNINETAQTSKDDCQDQTGTIRHPRIKYDENGVPRGISLQEFSDRLLDGLSEVYNVDLRKIPV